MIIFYEKKTGRIVGTIEGRVHGEEHLNMWIGEKKGANKTDRIVCNWVKTGEDEKDYIFEPEKQQKIFFEIDKNPKEVKKYEVSNGKLVPKKRA